ncbi:MAG TPA: SRPBCC domain-containing protein, partial [Devosia sp.]|nr:SRPBCC domain-containing protein [Devosia sp.]
MAKPLTLLTPSDREIVVSRDFDAPQHLVWDCYTRPDLIRRWYGLPDWPMIVCEYDARIGGRWRFVSRGPNGFEMGSAGEIVEFVPPTRIVSTELYDMDWTGGATRNTLSFSHRAG